VTADSSSRTSTSLLEQLRQLPADPAAWSRFVDRYGPRIYTWCRRWGLQDADAQDVAQDILLKLSKSLTTFRYDPSRRFRAWLRAVVRHAWQDWLARPQQRERCGSDEVWILLASQPAADDLEARIEHEFAQQLLAEAKECIRARVEPTTWEVYQLTAEQNLSAADTAARLNIPEARVYKYKSRVQQMLQAEVRELLDKEPQ
jgi:RNA polymerase sigma-70 factor (ECF subfamily)